MKTYQVYSCVLLLMTSLVLSNCKKKNDEPTPPTKTELLTAHAWKVKEKGVTTTTTIPTQFQSYFDAVAVIFTDSEFTFKQGGDLVVKSRSMNTTENGKWELKETSGKTTLTIEFDEQEWTFEVTSITQDQIIGKTVYNFQYSGLTFPIDVQIELIPV